MGPRKCSACGHTMGVTHAQYTQCPANAAKNVPASAEVPMLTDTMIEPVDEVKESSISSAFSLFNKTEADDDLTLEGAITIANLTDGVMQEEQKHILDNIYAQLDDEEKIDFICSLKSGKDKDELPEKFLLGLAKDPQTPNKVLKVLCQWRYLTYDSAYPEHVCAARDVRSLNRTEIFAKVSMLGSGSLAGSLFGGVVGGPVGMVVGAVVGPAILGITKKILDRTQQY